MWNRKLWNYLTLCVLAVALIATTVTAAENDPQKKDRLEFTGTVVHNNFEGGFFGIVADDGGKYDPTNLPKDYQKKGQRVKVIAKNRPDMASFHMWGTIIEIVDIQPAKAAKPDPPTAKDKKPKDPAEILRQSPKTVTIDGKTLQITASVIRNVMPSIGPGGPSVYIVIRLSTKDKSPLPKGLTYNVVFGLEGKKIWKTQTFERRSWKDGTIELVARKAPNWPAKAPIDVIVKMVGSDKKELLIQAPGVRVMEVH